MKIFKEINHYLQVYGKFASTSISEATSFRTSFILMIFMDVFFNLSSLFTISIIYDHVSLVGNWNKDQLLFFTCFMLVVDCFHMLFLSHGFWRFSDDLKTGNLDYTLLRPVSSIFTVFFRHFKPSSIPDLFLTVGLLIYFGIKVGLEIWQWIAIPFLVLISFTLLALIEFIISCAMFWLVEGLGVNFLRMQLQSMSRMPDFIYNPFMKRVLTFCIPILLVGSGPVQFLFDASKWDYVAYMIAAIILCYYFLIYLWNKGLNFYDSASS
ncbi:ABC transporter permease [Bacteriovorax sp. Seq25_V]|uniref:ABC transporter permease n=1 Tax=Bacteriovorax sp. Seq25_V TaxID=1201288 RepID=UPI00038A2037|nr:ABC-2 family transporter protein [Bacteriovorax sp. Seq25_V]EQC45633.1 ABC-2 family transporter protein [Bacteriovorax sp. Seq25_V]